MHERGEQVFCAYCEDATKTQGGHIEHLAARSRHIDYEFTWSNLFIACDAEHRCEKYKDSAKVGHYDWRDLVKPDVDDPDEFFYFSATGEVLVREGLDQSQLHRAEETIRVLNLNHRDFVGARYAVAEQARQMISDQDWEFIASLSPEEREEWLSSDLEYFLPLPFYTTVRHLYFG